MDRIPIFEEFRLIERDEAEVSGAWKGAHLLLFFMAFVFGSFCTFCFHMLMYLFDEKCVLFPKLQSLTSLKHNVIYEFFPVDKDSDKLPVDFLSSQWVEESACYLPTYVPLLSGIFGLVWTTMFLMCSTGPRTHTGLQRPWRVLPPVFVFSLVMSSVCIYSSAITHYGLNELCVKLGEITGSSTCSYTVNVATLAYERRIRGVYQAIRLTIISAWLHTMCWLLSAALAMIRVFLAVDFQLVRISVSLAGDIDKMLEHQEVQLRTVSPDLWINDDNPSQTSMAVPVHLVHFTDANTDTQTANMHASYSSSLLYVSKTKEHKSEHSLVPSESHKLARIAASQKYPKGKQFIVKIVYDLLLAVYEIGSDTSREESTESLISDTEITRITRQYGQDQIKKAISGPLAASKTKLHELGEAELNKEDVRTILEDIVMNDDIYEYTKAATRQESSYFNLDKEMRNIIETRLLPGSKHSGEQSEEKPRKPNLKNASSQTARQKRSQSRSQRVQITEPETLNISTETVQDADKETQTSDKDKKEKQD